MLNVEVMSIPGCPNAEPAVRVVHEIAAELGVPVQITRIVVEDRADAQRLSFFGSPSVRIEGEDLEKDRGSLPVSYGCRIYRDRGKLVGTPPEDLVRQRLFDLAIEHRESRTG